MRKAAKAMTQPTVHVQIESEVARQVRQHARSSMKTEVCGVLIGREEASLTIVDACIAGANAAQGGAHVTFTQDTWEHIYQIKDKKYPDARIVGWYHSHPGFGVFLSDHDLFIHQNFFSSPQQIAWVYDPHSDEEGCFGWRNGDTVKIDDVSVRFGQECGEIAVASDGEQPAVKVATRDGDEGIDQWEIMRYAAFCMVFFVAGVAAALFYVNNRMVLLPHMGSALVIIQDDKAVVVPPVIAQHLVDILQHEYASGLQLQQQPNSTQTSPGTGPGENIKGSQNGRQK